MQLIELNNYQKVQDAARYTLNNIVDFILPGVTELDLVKKCDDLQRKAGVDSYWYKSLPALVLCGENTNLAISNTAYEPSSAPIQETDLVTIDLNPSIAGYCGDYARTYYVENGIARRFPLFNPEFIAGASAQKHLHHKLLEVARPEASFGEIYQIIHDEINLLGFEQLDYLGHGVQKDMNNLDFIAPDVKITLGEVGLFTLEPHIRLKGGTYGFKHENIYYFQDGKLKDL